MSYAVTDAVEDDARAELKVLDKLNEKIDQLASEARPCTMLAPNVSRALDMAWFYTEEAMREVGQSSCGHVLTYRDLLRRDVKRSYCACCAHFAELHNLAQSVARIL